MYEFLTGIMFWLSVSICLGGIIVRAVLYIKGLNWQLDRVAYKAHKLPGLKGAARSIVKWLIPFGTYGWRKQPFMTVVFFGFHIGAVLVPFFLLAHNQFLNEKVGFSLFSFNQTLADVLTWTVVVSAVLLTLRRISLPEVRILTTAYDYLILILCAAPFITGLLARYYVCDYSFWLLLHIACGEALLISIPFTKMSHVVLFFLSRAQIGMDYGIKRGGMKGTGMAW
jgi:nitrate reductase gamma subunit